MKIEFFNNPKNLTELKKQYKELAKKYHPDINSNINLKRMCNK